MSKMSTTGNTMYDVRVRWAKEGSAEDCLKRVTLFVRGWRHLSKAEGRLRSSQEIQKIHNFQLHCICKICCLSCRPWLRLAKD